MASWLMCNVIAVLVATSGVLGQTLPGPSFVVSPTDTVAAVGHSVTLYCAIDNLGRHQVFWNINQMSIENTAGKEFTLGPNVNVHESYPRFQIVGDASSGEFNLQISEVTMIDAGSYICLVNDPNIAASTAMEAGAILTVVDTPEPPMEGYPQCSIAPDGNSQLGTGVYQEGDMLNLTCSSRGGVPLPKLTWVRVKEDDTTQELQSVTTVGGDVIITTARIDLSSVDHQSTYRCTETHPMTPFRNCVEPMSRSDLPTTLDVRFKPVVTITPDVVTVQTLETVTVELKCKAYANPPLTSGPRIILPEKKTGMLIDGSDPSKTAVMVDMTTDDVGKDFYCRAINDLGVGEDYVEVSRMGALPTWLTLVIIGAVALVVFIFIVIVSCILCVDRSDEVIVKRRDNLRYSVNKSRPTSMRNEGDGDFIDGYQDDDMVAIEAFQGGLESVDVHGDVHEADKGTDNDFETGEAGPRYQNVNEAFHGDSDVQSNSFSQSNPSSSEPIIDPDSE